MDRDFLIKITKEVYRLSLLFPKKEPLRYKVREAADGILASPDEKDLEVLDRFFELIKNQNWVKQEEILAIQKEYANLKVALVENKLLLDEKSISIDFPKADPKDPKFNVAPIEPNPNNQIFNERQEKILDFLKDNGRAQVWQLKEILPEVSKRTLRRDFEHLLGEGIIQRMGERNNTFYQLPRQES